MLRSGPLCRLPRLLAALALAVLLGGAAAPAGAVPRPPRTFVPIGAGYGPDTLQRFARAAAQHDFNGNVYLLVLPITFASDPYSITSEERADNLALADRRRAQVNDACEAVRRADQGCTTILVDMQTRSDAYNPENLARFTPDLDGVYILGGDQTIAMKVVADTPAERLMRVAYNAGVVYGGNSAGAAVQSANMIAGYTGDNGPEQGLQQGSVDLWTNEGQADQERGLIFGLPNAILDQHALQRGRLARLLNVSVTAGLPGIGVDAYTAAAIQEYRTLTDVVGESAVLVIDPQTYRAQGRFAGPTNSLSVRGVVTHLLPPGGYGYDLLALRPTVNGQPQGAPSIRNRAFDALRLPPGAGPLLLGGDISADKGGAVVDRFVALSGGQAGARLVVIAAGYRSRPQAQAAADAYAAAFQPKVGAPVQAFGLGGGADTAAILGALAGATGVFLTAPDQSTVLAALAREGAVVGEVRAAWQRGAALFADNAAAAALGGQTTRTPPRTDNIEDEAIASFRPDSVAVEPGLAFLPGVGIEPQVVDERRWGESYNLLYRDPSLLVAAIDVGTALELTQAGAVARGTSGVLVLDGRRGSLGVGSNGAVAARYVLLDSYVDGDAVQP
jgi:cyanophycinase